MKKILTAIVVIALLSVSLFGCAAQESPKDYYGEGSFSESDGANYDSKYEMPADEIERAPMMPEENYADNEEIAKGQKLDFDGSMLSPTLNRKIIFEGDMRIETTEFDEDFNRINDTVASFGGYYESKSVYGTKPVNWNDKGRTAQLVVRISSNKFDDFITNIKGYGQTVSMSTSGRDVSLQYFDTETHLKALRIRQERLLDLLENAKKLQDIISLEQELANVDYQIQSYEIELRTYDSLIDFSTITVELKELNQIERIATSGKQDIGTRIKTGFYSVLNVLTEIGEGLLIFLISGSPVLVPVAVLLALIIIAAKRRKKRRAQKNDQTGQQ